MSLEWNSITGGGRGSISASPSALIRSPERATVQSLGLSVNSSTAQAASVSCTATQAPRS
eukprot:3272283-Rhodomonas_salina.2